MKCEKSPQRKIFTQKTYLLKKLNDNILYLLHKAFNLVFPFDFFKYPSQYPKVDREKKQNLCYPYCFYLR